MTEEKIMIHAEYLFEFEDFNDWVATATRRFKKFNVDETICVDRYGYVATIGQDFMAARDQKRFPIMVYRLVRVYEFIIAQKG